MVTDVELRRDIGKIWGALEKTNGEIARIMTALIGLDGQNGLRGELREFMDRYESGHQQLTNRIKEVETKTDEGVKFAHQLYEVERYKPGQCIGKNALDAYVEELETKMGERKNERRLDDQLSIDLLKVKVELTKSRRAMLAVIIASIITVVGSLSTVLVTQSILVHNQVSGEVKGADR